MAATTTIKVTPSARDRFNEWARSDGMTPAALLERLVDEHDRKLRFAAVRAAYSAMPAEDDYADETAEWDAAGEDGLERA